MYRVRLFRLRFSTHIIWRKNFSPVHVLNKSLPCLFLAAAAAPPPPPATNVIRQGAKALPSLDDRKKTNGDNNRFASKGGNAIDKERIINIDTLNPYMNK